MIKIMVDSSADCREEQNVYDILVPLTVRLDGKSYLDGVDLNADKFYSLLLQTEDFPQTSQPSPEDFAKHFRRAKENGDEILYFSLSSALSGTYQSACIAKEMTEYDGIYIIDSKAATYLIAILAKYARSLVEQGQAAARIAEECEALKSRIKVLAGLDTLEYLYRGGRLSRASAAVGQVAGIKPIVTINEEGGVSAGSKAIGVPRAMKAILDRLETYALDKSFPLYSVCTCGTENADKFEQKLAAAGYATAGRRQVGSIIGAHVGPGVYGVIFVTK